MPPPVDSGLLLDAFKLAPQAAIEFFKKKGYTISWDAADVWRTAHINQFTVAKVAKLDILQDFHDAVHKALADGTTLQTFKNDLIPTLKSKGWWGRVPDPNDPLKTVQLGSPHRLQTIFQTNVQQAYDAGTWQQIQSVKKSHPFVRYVAILDGATRPAHRKLNGKIFRVDDPVLKIIGPQNGYNCRCKLVPVSQSEVERLGLAVMPPSKIIKRQALISRTTGEVRQVQGIKLHNGDEFWPDPGFDYNPGVKSFAPDLKKYDPKLVKAYEAETPPEVPPMEKPVLPGLAQRMPAKNIGHISEMVKTLHEENPELFLRGFKKVDSMRTKGVLMSTDSHGRISVSSMRQRFANGGQLQPLANLKDALKKISIKGEGAELTFNEEYSIESFWHEINHNRMQGWAALPCYCIERRVMETLNQFISRHTYPEFMTKLGGTATQQAAILDRGYGYENLITNFRALLKLLGIEEAAALETLTPVAYEGDFWKMPALTTDALAKLSGKNSGKIREALEMMRQINTQQFETDLKTLFEEVSS